jgi:hypothetical protein
MSTAQEAALELFKKPQADAVAQQNEYQREQEAMHMNQERLRSERLAREALRYSFDSQPALQRKPTEER